MYCPTACSLIAPLEKVQPFRIGINWHPNISREKALCLVYPTINFALVDSDCVPTTLFEVAELVNLMVDQASRNDALQRHTMGSARDCPPAVMLMTESRAELNAGLVIVTGHTQVLASDVDMEHGAESPSRDAPSDLLPKQATQGTTKTT